MHKVNSVSINTANTSDGDSVRRKNARYDEWRGHYIGEGEERPEQPKSLAQKATTVIKVCIVVVSRISTVTRGGGEGQFVSLTTLPMTKVHTSLSLLPLEWTVD